jgi:hypothetical protein
VELVNVYKGIDVATGRVLLRHVTGTPLCVGIHADGAADTVRIEDCNFLPTWCNGRAMQAWMQAHGVAYQIGAVDNWMMTNAFALSYSIGLQLVAGQSNRGGYGTAVTSGWDGCANAIVTDPGQSIYFPGVQLIGCEMAGMGGSFGTSVWSQHSGGDGGGALHILGGTGWASAGVLISGSGKVDLTGFNLSDGYGTVSVTGAADINIQGCRVTGPAGVGYPRAAHIRIQNNNATGHIGYNGTGCVVLNDAPGVLYGVITGGSHGLGLVAGGINQNVTAAPTGTGVFEIYNETNIRPGGAPAAQTFLRLSEPNQAAIYGQQWNFNLSGTTNSTLGSRLSISAGHNLTGQFDHQSDVISFFNGGGVTVGSGASDPGAGSLAVYRDLVMTASTLPAAGPQNNGHFHYTGTQLFFGVGGTWHQIAP